ncbi:MAG TPA: VWA domain-containing protein [Gaiellaceae bacterium]|nr:VWA domain-containing protein [Gaiellaceae bacterium]
MPHFLSPAGALVVLAVVLPLAATALLERRARVARSALGLAAPGRRGWLVPALCAVAVAALAAAAAAQPAVTRSVSQPVRTDAEVFFLVDTSRSMLASSAPGAETRIARAKDVAVELREAVADVPAGIVSLTDRPLPHLYPTADAEVFEQTMRRAVQVEHPPPLAPGARATTFEPLEVFSGSDLFFSPRARRRLLVVLTDGESRPYDVSLLGARVLDGAPLQVVLVHVWQAGERIFDRRGTPERAYRSDPASGPQLVQLARALRGVVASEDDLGAAATSVRRAAGDARATRSVTHVETTSLAPYAVLLAFAPLAVLLWRRNRA